MVYTNEANTIYIQMTFIVVALQLSEFCISVQFQTTNAVQLSICLTIDHEVPGSRYPQEIFPKRMAGSTQTREDEWGTESG